MTASSDQNRETGRGHGSFATTQWGEVLAAGDKQSPWHADALASLCEQYWPPVYAYVRRKGHSPEESKDMTQAFFVFLIEHHAIGRADPARGRFRNFLIGCLENFLSVQRRHERATNRGATQPFVVWDEAMAERLYAHVLVHRWRRQYREVLRGEIAASGVPAEEIEDEIRHLRSVLGDF